MASGFSERAKKSLISSATWAQLKQEQEKVANLKKTDRASPELVPNLQSLSKHLLGAVQELSKEIRALDRSTLYWSIDFLKILEDDILACSQRLDKLTFYVAVLGAMSSGKSVIINALVQLRISPEKDRACTMFPVKIMRLDLTENQTPIFLFPHAKYFNGDILPQLRATYKSITEICKSSSQDEEVVETRAMLSDFEKDYEHIVNVLINDKYVVREGVTGESEIFRELQILHDLVRILLKGLFYNKAQVDCLRGLFSNINNIPYIKVPQKGIFKDLHLRADIAFIDLPGPDEAFDGIISTDPASTFLHDVVTAMLTQCNFTVVASKALQIQSTTESRIRELAAQFGSSMVVAVTHYDEWKSNAPGSTPDNQVQAAYRQHGIVIASNQIFPICASRHVLLQWLNNIVNQSSPKIPTTDIMWRKLQIVYKNTFNASDVPGTKKRLEKEMKETKFVEFADDLHERMSAAGLYSIADTVALVDFICHRLLENYHGAYQESYTYSGLQDSITNLRTAFATKCYDEFSVVIDRLVAAVDEPLVKRSQELSKLCLGMIETGGQFKDIIAKHQADATTLFGNNLSAASRHGFSHSELTSSCLAHMNQELLKACASELSSASEKLAQTEDELRTFISKDVQRVIPEDYLKLRPVATIFTRQFKSKRISWLIDACQTAKGKKKNTFVSAAAKYDSRTAFLLQLLVMAKADLSKGAATMKTRIREKLMRKVNAFTNNISLKLQQLFDVMQPHPEYKAAIGRALDAGHDCYALVKIGQLVKEHIPSTIGVTRARIRPEVVKNVDKSIGEHNNILFKPTDKVPAFGASPPSIPIIQPRVPNLKLGSETVKAEEGTLGEARASTPSPRENQGHQRQNTEYSAFPSPTEPAAPDSER